MMNRESIAWWAIVALHVGAIWSVAAFPTQDGPTHVHNARLMLEMWRGGEVLTEYYQWNMASANNWLGHLMVLLILPLGATAAQKLMLSLAVLLFATGARAAGRSFGGERGVLAGWLLLPFLWNQPWAMGFFSFSLSIGGYLLMMAWWWRRRRRMSAGRTVTLAVGLLVLYLLHVFAFAAWCLTVLVLVLGEIAFGAVAARSRQGNWRLRAVGRRILRRGTPVLLASAPALGLIAWFALRGVGRDTRWLSVDYLLWRLLQVEALQSFHPWESALGVGVFALFAVAGLLAVTAKIVRRSWRSRDAALLLTIAFGLVYLLAPDTALDGAAISIRVMLLPFLAAALWLGIQDWPGSCRVLLMAASALLSIGLLCLKMDRVLALQPQLAEARELGRAVPRGTETILQVNFDDRGVDPEGRPLSTRVRPFAHVAGSFDSVPIYLGNYQAWQDTFPLRWREEVDPLVHMSTTPRGIGRTPPQIDIPSYEARTGVRVDALLVVGAPALRQADAEEREVLGKLSDWGFAPRGDGYAVLWLRMD